MSATAGQAADGVRSLADRFGIEPGMVVMEMGYDEVVDQDLRDALTDRCGELVYEDTDEVVDAVRAEVIPLSRNYFRTATGLVDSLSRLDDVWTVTAAGLTGGGRDALRARQAAAMTAHARWMYRSALARTESRGMHRRDDAPAGDPAFTHRIHSGGLDRVWTAPERTAVPA